MPLFFVHRTPQRTWIGPLDSEPGGGVLRFPLRRAPAAGQAGASPLQVLQVLTRSDFRARYRAQALGIVWSVLNPLVMMGILSVVFTRVFHNSTRFFPIFLLIGLLLWQWVSNSLSAGTQVFVSQADVVKRTVFARSLLPTSIVLSYGINFFIESLALLAFVPLFPGAFTLSPALLLIPVFLLCLVVTLTGLVLATSVLNVIYRDVAYLVNTGLLILYWLTPVVYPMDVLSRPYAMILRWNPFAAVITATRRALMDGAAPDLLGWATLLLPAGLCLLLGMLIFRHYERMVLDHV